MTQLSPHLTAEKWLFQLFSSKAACDGGVICRQARDIERLVGMQRFEAELDRRGFHAVQNAGQLVVFCNQQPVSVIR